MKETVPKVHLIVAPSLRWKTLEAYVKSVGGGKWTDRIVYEFPRDSGSILIEAAGRLCYRSWDVGLNLNVTKVREDSKEYFTNLLKSKHGSVLEHANYSFIFQDVSRVFTHELVRHRAGVAISQESLRYVRLTELGFRIPSALETLRPQIVDMVERLEDFQKVAASGLHLDDSTLPFHIKKEVTSALRRLAPLGLSTTVFWTANVRTLRHVISMRTEKGAEEEIRTVFQQVARIMQRECPLLFEDFAEDSDGAFVTPYWKV